MIQTFCYKFTSNWCYLTFSLLQSHKLPKQPSWSSTPSTGGKNYDGSISMACSFRYWPHYWLCWNYSCAWLPSTPQTFIPLTLYADEWETSWTSCFTPRKQTHKPSEQEAKFVCKLSIIMGILVENHSIFSPVLQHPSVGYFRKVKAGTLRVFPTNVWHLVVSVLQLKTLHPKTKRSFCL
jgi:hypothetical protein